MAKLKVFRMPIGFHDAYVAAPSRKAALAAWGSEHDLFARGMAEEVTDPALTAAPLAAPGTVIKRSRGSIDEQIAALPPARRAAGRPGKPAKERPADKPAKPRPPRPTRDPLDAAEQAIGAAARQHDDADARLRARIAALEDERKALARTWDRDRRTLEQERDDAAAAYDEAMRAWRE